MNFFFISNIEVSANESFRQLFCPVASTNILSYRNDEPSTWTTLPQKLSLNNYHSASENIENRYTIACFGALNEWAIFDTRFVSMSLNRSWERYWLGFENQVIRLLLLRATIWSGFCLMKMIFTIEQIPKRLEQILVNSILICAMCSPCSNWYYHCGLST